MSTNSLSFSALYLVFFGLFQIAEANIDGRIKIRAEIEEVRRSVNVISEKLKQLKESDHAKIDLGSSKVFSGNLKPSKKNKSDDISNVALYSEMRAEIEEVRRSLTGIGEKLNKLKESDHAKIVSGSSTAFSGNLKPSKKNKLDVVSNVPLQTNVEHRVNEDSKIGSSGFYILPFSGLLTSQNLAWESPFF